MRNRYPPVIVIAAIAFVNLCVANELPDSRQKKIEIVRAETPPVIDGRLDDDVWKQAIVIDDLHQVRPHEFAAPNAHTVFYLIYDKDALYIGAHAFDNSPDKIIAQILKQGGMLLNEDRVGIILDPYNDKRSGYMFELNPNGVRLDGLFINPTEFNPQWDGIWRGKSEYREDGYTAEFEIPFKTLSFNPDNETWGLNVWREVVRNQEKMSWVSYNRAWNPAASGEMSGLKDMDIGMGLDIIPSMSMRQIRNFDGHGTKYKLEPSFDLFYKFSPDLNGSLTVNTDFSAVEIDDRQVDLTRFNLFFPEKRDFFLKDSEIFEFGNIGGFDPLTTVFQVEREDGRPFFSRNIGLSKTGEPVDLEYGGKLSGRIGQWNIGTLAIRQAEHNTVGATNLFVGRVSRSVLGESSIGAILTYGDPTSDLDNILGGIDFRYLNTSLPGGRTLEGKLWYQKSDTQSISGNDAAWGAGIRSPNVNKFRGRMAIKELQKNFNPALGFANRRGIRDHIAEVGYTHRPKGGLLREIYGGLDVRHVEELDGGLQSQNIKFRLLELTSFQGDSIRLRYDLNKEGLSGPFEISKGIDLPRGLYRFNRFSVFYTSSPTRKLSLDGGYFDGNYFNGRRLYLSNSITWRPGKHINLKVFYEMNDVDLEQGDFITRLMTFQSDIVFSNTLSWTTLVQFDNISDNLGFNSRIHWNREAGQDLFFVFNYNMIDTKEGFVSTRSDITLKASYTFRY